jgi:DNA-binding XRE family transcriptional regulator
MPALHCDRAAMRRIREARGLSRQELADRVGRHVSSINRWEYGIKTPLLDGIGKLADALSVEYTELIASADREAVPRTVAGRAWPYLYTKCLTKGRMSAGDQPAAARTASTTLGTDSGCSHRNRFGSTSSSSITHG